MLKIVLTEASSEVVLRLEGRVIGPWVGELGRSCDEALEAGKRLALDLSGVSFIDHSGVTLLQSLRERDVTVRNSSGFVTEQLKAGIDERLPLTRGERPGPMSGGCRC